MSFSPHRILHELYRGPKMIDDPGNGGVIRANADLQICEMTSGASDETRVLANPTKPGISFVLRMKTDGGGAINVTSANGLNVALAGNVVFADVGDALSLTSVSLTATTYRWEILVRTGAAVATSTATATATSTSTATVSASRSATATQTVTATGSGTKTDSPTATQTETATQTTSATGTATSTSTATATATQ